MIIISDVLRVKMYSQYFFPEEARHTLLGSRGAL